MILPSRVVWRSVLLLTILVQTALRAPAQDSDKELQQTLEELLRSNAELRERVDLLERDPFEDESLLLEEDDGQFAGDIERQRGMVAKYGDVQATFKIFGDFNARYDDPSPESRAHSSFAFGTLVLFNSTQIGDHFRILSETKIEGDGDGTEFDQERVWGQYDVSDAFYAKLGLEHSPISRWNKLFHHGSYLETSIDRPFLVRFEGEDGILPLHNTGIEIGGEKALDKGQLDWYAILSNGRGISPVSRQKSADRNSHKAIDLGLGFIPTSNEDLHVGIAGRTDLIPPDPSSPDPDRAVHSIRQNIYTAFVDYDGENLEVIAEAAVIHDEQHSNGDRRGHNAGYVQVAKPCGDWTPYTRVGYRNMRTGDPFFASEDRDLDRWRHTLGMRYEINANAAAKLEVGYGEEEQREGGIVDDEDVTFLAFQLSWVF